MRAVCKASAGFGLVIAASIGCVSPAYAVPISLSSGSQTIISGSYDGGVVSNGATLNVIGGNFGPDALALKDHATLNMVGGSIQTLQAGFPGPGFDDSMTPTVNLLGGDIDDLQWFASHGTMNMFDGHVGRIASFFRDYSTYNFFGGQLDRFVTGYGAAQLDFYGYGFTLCHSDCVGVPEDESLNAPTPTNRYSWLTGFWADGTPFGTLIGGDEAKYRYVDCSVQTCSATPVGDYVYLHTVTQVPEPSTAAVFLIGIVGLLVARRRFAQPATTLKLQ
jgi:hypothetical protein